MASAHARLCACFHRLTSWGQFLDSRQGVRWALFIWIAVSLLEYVILGPRSFLWMDDEGDLVVTHYNFLTHIHPGGQYSHLIQGGADALGAFFFGAAYVSLDSLLIGLLPLWIAIAIHKAVVFALGSIGTYVLCRRGFGASRIAALALGCLFTVMFYRLQIVTFGTGLSLSLLPLGVYLCVVRQQRRRYWLGVAAYSVLFAVAGNFHAIPPLGTALVAAAILLGRLHGRIVAAGSLVMLVFLLDNAESFNAMISLSAQSARGSADDGGASASMVTTFGQNFIATLQNIWAYPAYALPILVSGMAFAVRRDWTLLVRVAVAVLVPPVAIGLFYIFPWHVLGLAAIRTISFSMATLGLLPVAALAGARAVDLTAEILRSRPDARYIPALAVGAVAVLLLGQYKIHNLSAWLTTAGQSMYTTLDNIRTRPWAPDEPFRAISLRHKQMQPEQNIFFSFYGVAMFDAWTNLVSTNHAAYWRYGIHKNKDNNGATDVALDAQFFVADNDAHYRIGEQITLPLLAAANVRYIFSPVPLTDSSLRYVDGPSPNTGGVKVIKDASNPVSNTTFYQRAFDAWRWQRAFERWHWQLGRLFDYGKVYIYEIDNALPRVYAARAIVTVGDDVDAQSFLAELAQLSPRTFMARTKDAKVLEGFPLTAEVRSFQPVIDGYDIAVDAPDGGVIIVNAEWQPFFTAYADSAAVPLVAVNMIQTAVPVPAGTRALTIRYHRPTIVERFAGR